MGRTVDAFGLRGVFDAHTWHWKSCDNPKRVRRVVEGPRYETDDNIDLHEKCTRRVCNFSYPICVLFVKKTQEKPLVQHGDDDTNRLGTRFQQQRDEEKVSVFCTIPILLFLSLSRTLRFCILGMSLSGVFDITNANDLLKSLLNILTEYDQSKDENYKPKMVRITFNISSISHRRGPQRLFRTSKAPKRQVAGMNDYTMSAPDNDASYLITPHVVSRTATATMCYTHPFQPFPLDYHQTLLSLLDILSEVYHKISKVLGPSQFPHNGQYMMGPLGVLTPHPGVSYLFQEGQQADVDGTLWGIANGTHITNGVTGGALISPPPAWTPGLGDTILKIDGKLKASSKCIPFFLHIHLHWTIENNRNSVERAGRFRSKRNKR